MAAVSATYRTFIKYSDSHFFHILLCHSLMLKLKKKKFSPHQSTPMDSHIGPPQLFAIMYDVNAEKNLHFFTHFSSISLHSCCVVMSVIFGSSQCNSFRKRLLQQSLAWLQKSPTWFSVKVYKESKNLKS